MLLIFLNGLQNFNHRRNEFIRLISKNQKIKAEDSKIFHFFFHGAKIQKSRLITNKPRKAS